MDPLESFLEKFEFYLEEPRGVVVDVLDDNCQSSCGRLGRNAVVDGQDLHLMTRSVFTIQMALDGDGAVLIDGELTPTIRGSIDGEGNFAFASLIRISGAERFQTLANFSILINGSLDVGFLKERLVVIDVTQFDVHPAIGNVILVVIIVLALGFFFDIVILKMEVKKCDDLRKMDPTLSLT